MVAIRREFAGILIFGQSLGLQEDCCTPPGCGDWERSGGVALASEVSTPGYLC
ncbi:MAG: hypothetical protein K8R88_13805 [Armatimonadetes bacterium]|nr:hypothetical protein [Armatimonadota bacterium]